MRKIYKTFKIENKNKWNTEKKGGELIIKMRELVWDYWSKVSKTIPPQDLFDQLYLIQSCTALKQIW